MQPLPYMHVPPKSRFFKSTSSNTENLRNYKTFLLQILIIFHDMTIVSTEEGISYKFLILVTSKPRFFKFTYLKHREPGGITKPFSYRYWLFFMIWLLWALRKWYHTTSSYWWPPNQGFSCSLPQTQRTWGITKPFSYRYWLFFMIWLLWALRKWYHTTSSYWWPPNQVFSSSLPQTQRTWGITKPFSDRYWLFFMIWLLCALRKWYHTNSLYWRPPNQGFFKFTTSNTENLRNYKTFPLHILIIFYDMTIVSTDIMQLPHKSDPSESRFSKVL